MKKIMKTFLLPDGINEILPNQAIKLEKTRRDLLDLYYKYGYNFVITTQIEYLETLLNNVGSDLELQTFKLIDTLSGKLIGLSADSTPQIARLDSRILKNQGPYRICYCTNVFRAFTVEEQNDLGRNPIQVGIELLGYIGIEADIEIINLTIKSLRLSGAKKINLSFGHLGIYRILIKKSKIEKEYLNILFESIENKSYTDVENIIKKINIDLNISKILKILPRLHGDFNMLKSAYKKISFMEDIKIALDQLIIIYKFIKKNYKNISIYFDLSDFKGYQYHNGIIFTVYVSGYVQSIAKGGRYDIGKNYGKKRPSTGCTMDLNLLTLLNEKKNNIEGIWAPDLDDLKLKQKIEELRFYGEKVIQELPNQIINLNENNCNRKLCLINKEWQVISL
ncbi:ATP phosphoribosyltransferase regulatory subunit [Candidatus Portiera aleyrodidarum]|nr:ATP phosphoribosyltransferase regulatory subunit [Candidatus Portiera aleyrodidarum]